MLSFQLRGVHGHAPPRRRRVRASWVTEPTRMRSSTGLLLVLLRRVGQQALPESAARRAAMLLAALGSGGLVAAAGAAAGAAAAGSLTLATAFSGNMGGATSSVAATSPGRGREGWAAWAASAAGGAPPARLRGRGQGRGSAAASGDRLCARCRVAALSNHLPAHAASLQLRHMQPLCAPRARRARTVADGQQPVAVGCHAVSLEHAGAPARAGRGR